MLMRMDRLTHFAVMLVTMLAVACSNAAQPSRASTKVEEVPAGPNTLTDAERAAGWQLLFDGHSTTGWRGFRQTGIPSGWQAIDGALTRVSGGGDVVTTDQFSNFELALEWQIGEGGNSGIMYRVSEAADATFFSGPEFQVIDNARNPDGGTALTSAGACYALYAPTSDVTRPAGAWNGARIVANGTHVEHWLNGVQVVDYELGSADWLARVQASMFRGVSTYGRDRRGHIALQDHGDRVAYRAVKIKPLP
jgi:hypothetical protein